MSPPPFLYPGFIKVRRLGQALMRNIFLSRKESLRFVKLFLQTGQNKNSGIYAKNYSGGRCQISFCWIFVKIYSVTQSVFYKQNFFFLHFEKSLKVVVLSDVFPKLNRLQEFYCRGFLNRRWKSVGPGSLLPAKKQRFFFSPPTFSSFFLHSPTLLKKKKNVKQL